MPTDIAETAGFRQGLIAAGLLIPLGDDGLFARSGTFESVISGIESMAQRAAGTEADSRLRFPPVIPRSVLEGSGYPRSFPDLLGVVSGFSGNDADHAELLKTFEAGGDWTAHLSPTPVALCSAACHPVYPLLTGELPVGGRTIELLGYCFRHEPSIDPARMQAFRQLEFVRIGSSEETVAHRDKWVARAATILTELGLEPTEEVANDPFFGRVGRVLARSQRAEALKLEVICEIGAAGHMVAVSSGNCHGEHFGEAFSIATADGDVATTACIGFGLERITLALLWRHGLDVEAWPAAIRSLLWP